MRHELAMTDWEKLLSGKTVDRQWQTFKERMDELQQLFIPALRKSETGNVAKPWLTREIRYTIRSQEERGPDSICLPSAGLYSFHLHCFWRILGIRWQDRTSITEVRRAANIPSIHTLLSQQHLRWLGHPLQALLHKSLITSRHLPIVSPDKEVEVCIGNPTQVVMWDAEARPDPNRTRHMLSDPVAVSQNLRTVDCKATTMDQNLRGIDWNVTTMDLNLRMVDWKVRTMGRSISSYVNDLSANYDSYSLEHRIIWALHIFQYIYYPILAIVGVPVNLVTIMILSRGKCGLSECVTRYLVAMAVADLLVVILDLILRQIPILYREQFYFLQSIYVCNIHAVLLFAATDCSVWFTVSFTFDRFVAICCQKLKSKYCTERMAAVVLGTITVLSSLKNITWYFMLTGRYVLFNNPWFCFVTMNVWLSPVWIGIEFLHYIVTPCVPFVLILLLNAFTVRHILVSSRVRRRLRACSNGENPRDPEMESRRKSIILLLVISANFILLWAVLTVSLLALRLLYLGYYSADLPDYVLEMGFMLQLLSCCTNTCIYAVTQAKFREQLKNVLQYPFTLIITSIQ
ncbi:probable G-protein coupled receptor 142 [Heterodontus francisci]|uniref:probable G-protein coupled receptor 142 n=1 Tax=Heterodontus francisci TaxID=7792 RepID=UPI00355C457D